MGQAGVALDHTVGGVAIGTGFFLNIEYITNWGVWHGSGVEPARCAA